MTQTDMLLSYTHEEDRGCIQVASNVAKKSIMFYLFMTAM